MKSKCLKFKNLTIKENEDYNTDLQTRNTENVVSTWTVK